MNSLFDKAELVMLDEMMKKGVVTGKRYTNKKKYIRDLVRHLYLNL